MISQIKDDCSDEDKFIRPNIFITDEASPEIVYTDILETLVQFVQNISDQEGCWREHLLLLKNIEETVHFFYMPEIHIFIVPILKAFAVQGNNNIRNQTMKCLAIILKYQHHTPAREELMEFIKSKLFKGKNFSHRRTFIWFCKHVITQIPF